jgi:hypothetical protein
MERELTPEKALEDFTEPRVLKGAYEKMCAQFGFLSYSSFLDMVRRYSPRLVENSIQTWPERAAEFRRTHIDDVSSEFGLICLSEVPNDILMWGHYTLDHTGFVIGFDTSHDFFSKGPSLLKIDYVNERVLMGQSTKLVDPKRAEQIDALIRRKSPHWAYEKEWRQLHFLQHCTPVMNKKTGSNDFYLNFKPDLVRTIILGCRAAPEFEREFRDLAKTQLRNLDVGRYDMDESEFALVPRVDVEPKPKS